MFSSWRRIILGILSALVIAQACVLTVLTVIAELRKRRTPPAQFPHTARLDDIVEQNTIGIYTYGSDLYAAMLDAIDGAQHTIYLETFIWKGDRLGEVFKARLARRAAEGVQVFVIFDGLANLVVPSRFKYFPPTIHALEFRTLSRTWSVLDPRRYALDHRKLLVIDDETAFIGGFNIGQLYATEWRDTHLRIRGPAARDLAAAFVEFWNTNRTTQRAIDQAPERPWPGAITVQRNDPARLIFPVRGMYIDAIDRAQRHVYITNAYFIPDQAVLDALTNAARRGVDVRILLPWQSNHVSADWLARGFFATCLRHGVRIFAYQNAMIHAKTATIDGVWSTVGTANLDRLSLTGNYEINVAIRDAGVAATLELIFEHDLTNARELTLDMWERRPWYARLSELVLSPLRPLL